MWLLVEKAIEKSPWRMAGAEPEVTADSGLHLLQLPHLPAPEAPRGLLLPGSQRRQRTRHPDRRCEAVVGRDHSSRYRARYRAHSLQYRAHAGAGPRVTG